jgi:long-subunit fatty acid transport protein
LALAPAAFGQDRPQSSNSIPSGIAQIPFDLLPPGARALGLAGAFTAVADDATAAEANPAGLAILTRPEISLHGRNTSFDLATFNGDASYADIYDDRPVDPFPLYNKASGDSSAVSFASYVHPFENGAVSLYYYNTGRIDDRTTHTGESTFFNDFFTFENKVDLTAEAVGLSAAYRLNDLLAVGGSLRYSRLSLTSRARNSVSFLFDLENQGNGTNFTGVTDEVSFERGIDDEDNDITFNLGLLLNPGGKFSAGLVYKDGGSYTLRSTNAFNVNIVCTVTATQNCGGNGENVNFTAADSIVRNAKVELPDVINLGFAYRPTDLWLLSFDIHHTRFSQLPAQPGASLIFGSAAPNAFSVVGPNNNTFLAVDQLSNSTTYHFGVEHTFVFSEAMMGMRTLALRGGVFNEKDLGTYSDDETRGLDGVDNRDTHYTVGIGSTFGDHIQVDLGAEFSDDTDNIVLSGIYRF